jgi:hypothetical protein
MVVELLEVFHRNQIKDLLVVRLKLLLVQLEVVEVVLVNLEE